MDRVIGLGFVWWVVSALVLSACALAALAEPWMRRRRSALAPLQFQPQPLAPVALVALAGGIGGGVAVISGLAGRWEGVAAAPLVALGSGWGIWRVARWWYSRQLRRQVGSALAQLTALVSGSSALLGAFRTVAQSHPWPLGAEWSWVDQQVQTPMVVREHGRPVVRYIDHAQALMALATQTWDPLHAQALHHLASIYESGAESAAAPRLRALTEAISQAERMQREARQALSRVMAQAYVIVGAMTLVALWLLVSQPERMHQAFVMSPFGLTAAIWFSAWLAAPLALAWWVTRMPDWPI